MSCFTFTDTFTLTDDEGDTWILLRITASANSEKEALDLFRDGFHCFEEKKPLPENFKFEGFDDIYKEGSLDV